MVPQAALILIPARISSPQYALMANFSRNACERLPDDTFTPAVGTVIITGNGQGSNLQTVSSNGNSAGDGDLGTTIFSGQNGGVQDYNGGGTYKREILNGQLPGVRSSRIWHAK